MSTENKKFVIGVQAVYVRRPDGVEEQLVAAQDCQISGKITQTIKKGDNALTALAVINSAKDIKISGKHAKTSLSLMTLLMGGTKTQVAANSFSQPEADTPDCSMKNAIVISGTNGDAKQSDIFTFFATGPNTFDVVRSSDGSKKSFTTASYPQNQIIPGLTLVVNGTLDTGSVANVKTTAVGQTIETRDEAASDSPASIPVRVVTEPSDDGQFDILFYATKSGGIDTALKTKDFGELSFEFTAFVEPTLGKIAQWRTISTPALSSC